MEAKNKTRDKNLNLEQLALKVKNQRDQGGKRVRFSEDLRKEVVGLILNGVKIQRLCKETGLSYGGVLKWVNQGRKFKSLKVVKTRKPPEKSLPLKPTSCSSLNVRLASGAEVELDLETFTGLLEKGVL